MNIIPNDEGGDWILNKFVEYQHEVPPVHYEIFKEYTKNKKLSLDDQIYLSWLMCNTYQEITSLLILEEVPLEKDFSIKFNTWYKENKHRVVLGSSKKHMAYIERLENVMYWFEETFTSTPSKVIFTCMKSDNPSERTEELKSFIRQCKEVGRFASDYFIETLHLLQMNGYNDLNLGSIDTVDWDDGSNLTSGLFNVLNKPDLADKFDKGKMSKQELEDHKPELEETLLKIKNKINQKYDSNIDSVHFVPKLCSFRNLWKSNRYGGFHHDRQLGVLNKYLEVYPSKKELFEFIFKIRKEKFKSCLLGELNGWKGIRTERKKLWVKEGLTGIEPESIRNKLTEDWT